MGQPQNSGVAWAEAIVSTLRSHGVTTFFVCPGSRSTPLVLAVARHPGIQTVVHFDERGAAFAALGFARATGGPAAVVTTSGTAVANLFPAVVEASMDAQPLIVMTADRPSELRGTGANQTIDQVEIFGSYVRFFADLPAPNGTADVDAASLFAAEAAAEAVAEASGATPGPVHLNCMFRKPLEPDFYPAAASPIGTPSPEHRRTRRGRFHARDEDLAALGDELRAARRGVVIAGRMTDSESGRAVERLAQLLEWPLFADIGSQVPRQRGSSAIVAADALLQSVGALPGPDCVLHFGGRFVSVRLGRWLAEHRPPNVIHVCADGLAYDPHGVITRRLVLDPVVAADRLLQDANALQAAATVAPAAGSGPTVTDEFPTAKNLRDEWARWWRASSEAAASVIEELDVAGGDDVLTEPAVAHLVWKGVPPSWPLLVGNSMPVRDFDVFAWGAPGPALVVTNRGASGIDGLVATACGVGHGSCSPVVAVVGDVSMLHDLNSLALVAQSAYPVIVVVVNNDGGGIFSFLPIARHRDVFEEFFAAPHGWTFEAAAEQFGLDYHLANTRTSLYDALAAVRSGVASAVIEVRTDRLSATSTHDRIMSDIGRLVADTA